MQVHQSTVRKAIDLLLLSSIALEISIFLCYTGTIWQTGKPWPLFDVDGKMSLPSFLQAGQIFAMGVTSLVSYQLQRKSSQPPSRLFLLTIGCLLIYISLDELFKIYQNFPLWLPSVPAHYWKQAYLLIILTIPAAFYRDFKALWQFYRRETVVVALGLGIFIVGGYVTEVFKIIFLQPLLLREFQQGDFTAFFLEKIREGLEEFLEMLGQSVSLYGILLCLAKRLEKIGE